MPAQPRREGFHLRCWTCGRTYPPSRRKAVLHTGCAATKLATTSWNKLRTSRLGPTANKLTIFAEHLKRLNQLLERRHAHWPEVHRDSDMGDKLRCVKRGYQVACAKRGRILHGLCNRAAANLQAVLIPHGNARGGDTVKLGTLNVGTLRHREHEAARLGCHLLAVQETCIAESSKTSVASTLRQVGGSVVFGMVADEDKRKRKRHTGIRLGAGVAILAFAPWHIAPADGLWPWTALDSEVGHRLVSGVAVHGRERIVCHSLYLSPQGDKKIDEKVYLALTQRIAMAPHANHWVAGDFQGDSRDSALGAAFWSLGWLPHSAIMPQDHCTNWPTRGTARILDDAWLAPNLAKCCVSGKLERLAGWSTHALLTLEVLFEKSTVEGDKLVVGL